MSDNKISVAPDVCSYFIDNETKICINISLPGVKKEKINLKLLEDNLFLSAQHDDIKFTTTLAMCCPIVPQKAEAKYEDGLLRIIAPLKDRMDGAIAVKIQ